MDVVKLIPSENPMMGPGMLDVSGIRRKYLDISYADASPRQVLDIYLPDEGDGPFPTIVYIHGGAFVGGDKRDNQFIYVIDGIRRGYAVVSVEQRLLPEGVFPLPLFDFKAAIRFLKANALKFCLDPNKFATGGDSAGAYHAAMAAATQDIPAFEGPDFCFDEPDSKVKAVIGLFGVYDLAMQSKFTIDAGPFPGTTQLFNFADMFVMADSQNNPGIRYCTNPINFVTKAMPYTLLQTGDSDQVVPYKASLELAEKIEKVCGKDRVQLDVYPDKLHGDPVFESAENIDRIFAFLDKHLK